MKNKEKIVICWFRRDLRMDDHAAFFHALKSGYPVLPLFIFDENILSKLPEKTDRRISLIYSILESMHVELQKTGSGLFLKKGKPLEVFNDLLQEFNIQTVFTNTDYEPYANTRDSEVERFLLTNQINFISLKDQVIFEKNDVLKSDNQPYTVFTPYAVKWKQKQSETNIYHFPSEEMLGNCIKTDGRDFFSLESIGFKSVPVEYKMPEIDLSIIQHYNKTRDFPGISGTSKLSIHLRFGTISIRKLVRIARMHNETWLNELIWREFFMMILWHFPKVENQAFKYKYEKIPWRFDKTEFKNWCEGNTGFPMVDAGMRELNETGFMHNRVRMITANFFTKLMLHNWRLGEAYFAEKLLDYDLSANNGNWQWSAGCGCDAAPYFRIFNPEEQIRKFDPEKKYIQKWVTELESKEYTPMLDYKTCRERALFVYKTSLDN